MASSAVIEAVARTEPLTETVWLKERRVLSRLPIRRYFGELLAVRAPTLNSIKLVARSSISVSSDATVKATSCSRDALFNHIWQQTDLPPSRGANSAVENGNRRPLRPLMLQDGLSRYCIIPAASLQNIYADYVLIGIWDIPSSKIQVYGIFCPLNDKYMGYSVL
jgi:hypothetical protein